MAKAKPKDLGTGQARKAGEALSGRGKVIEKAVNEAGGGSGSSRPSYSEKSSVTIDMSNSGAYKDYQLKKAKEDMRKRKK